MPGVSEGEREGSRKLFKETIAESFPNLGRELKFTKNPKFTKLTDHPTISMQNDTL